MKKIIIPIAYFILYISSIFIFAFIYNHYMPYEFYHSTSKHEKTLDNDKSLIMLELENYLKKTLLCAHGKQIIMKDSIFFDINSIKIYELFIEDDIVKFKLRGWYLDKNLRNSLNSFRIFSFELYPLYMDKPDTLVDEQGIQLVNFTQICSDRYDPITPQMLKTEDIFIIDNLNIKYRNGGDRVIDDKCGIGFLPTTLFGKLNAYEAARHGFPSCASGNFWRMFYFSAMILTTVGTGDIVPISTTARIVVAFQAIFGITVMGFFFHAITKKG